jgi:hypothetical protein
MATLRQKMNAEQRLRELVAAGKLPEPDHIEYGRECVRAFWDVEKVVLVVDLDEAPDDSLTA